MRRDWLLAGVAASSVLGLATACDAAVPQVQIQTQVTAFDIAAGPLETGLRTLALQSGERVLFDPTITVGLSAPALRGRMTTEAALDRLLAGSGLTAQRTARNVLIVQRPAQRTAEVVTQVEDVVVTGSLIRGLVDGPSPVVIISRDAMDQDGRATVAQALQALPQNFAGMANDEASANGGDRSASNSSQAAGVNLRGLGADATLVLINGRRVGGTGTKGDYADVSSVPTSAIARIDVLLDGGSALYGADAVGGVVNIILRDDYDGQETRVRYGSATDGATDEVQFGQTFGRRWATGNLLATYEYYARDNLPVSERRALAGDADLRPLGACEVGLGAGIDALAKAGRTRLRPLRSEPLGGVAAFIAAYHLGDPISAADSLRPWTRRSHMRHKLASTVRRLQRADVVAPDIPRDRHLE